MIKKLLLLTILLQSYLYSCALCTVYQPTVEPKVVFKASKQKLQQLKVTWKFSQEFSAELSRDYDKNANNRFEKKEIEAIERSLIEYIEPLNFLTTLKINPAQADKMLDEIKPLPIDSPSYQTYFVDDLLHFSYQVRIDKKIKTNDVLFLTIHDEGGYFIFKFKNSNVSFEGLDLKAVANSRADALFIQFQEQNQSFENKKRVQEPLQSETKEPEVAEKTDQETGYLARLLQQLSEKLQQLLQQIKEQNSFWALFLILLFSLLYGAVHAAGPGHGKTVVASYIFSSDKGIKKALLISLLIGLVHAFSAFILTLVIYFLVSGFLIPFADRVEVVVTKLSAVVIIAIALFMLYKKIKLYYANKNRPRFSTHKPSCSCIACKVDSSTTDLGVILSAGMVPCPGTVIIFIVTISQQMLLVGFLSALFMSLGMSMVIFITALFSITMKKQLKNQTLITVFEYGSLLLILTIGGLMLLL